MAQPLLSSRVTTIKWLGVGQLILSLVMLVVGVVYFALDFADVAEIASNDADDAVTTHKNWTYQTHLVLTILLVLMGMLSGVPAAAMSRYEGLTHNISLKNQVLANSVSNGFASIFYMAFGGTQFFEDIDKLDVFEYKSSHSVVGDYSREIKAVYALLIVVFILAFFNMVLAFATVIAAALWTPKEDFSNYNGGSRKQDYVVDDGYYREERGRGGEYNRSRQYPPNYYYGPGYRSLPPIKY